MPEYGFYDCFPLQLGGQKNYSMVSLFGVATGSTNVSNSLPQYGQHQKL